MDGTDFAALASRLSTLARLATRAWSWTALWLGIFVAQPLLVNSNAFRRRFYLFLVPTMGAAVGETARCLVRAGWPPERRRPVAALFGPMLITAAGFAALKSRRSRYGEVAEPPRLTGVR